MFILMDTKSGPVRSEININFIKPLLTVHSLLHEKGALRMLDDPLVDLATGADQASTARKAAAKTEDEDSADDTTASARSGVRATMTKADAVSALVEKYRTDSLKDEEIVRVLDSIADNNAYLEFNVKPVERMIQFLKTHFDRAREDEHFSLELTTGSRKKSSSLDWVSSFSSYVYKGYSSGFNGSGACLTHSHSTQYSFVLQSLTLWSEIMANMPKLWTLAEVSSCKYNKRISQSCASLKHYLLLYRGTCSRKCTDWPTRDRGTIDCTRVPTWAGSCIGSSGLCSVVSEKPG